ncbi:uncharacterized protein [Porites lutea]|uniref:uncharacterized protein n=1 Tax=Porites lutea TaxID=51062 RepID=UPI003CC69354
MDEEDEHSPSEFYYPEDLETFDVETETGITESQEAIDDFINQQKSANTNKKTATDMNTLLRYTEADGMKIEKIESVPASELDHLLSFFFLNARKKNGEEYEPATVSSFQRSIQRYLTEKKYAYNILKDQEFQKSRGREVLLSKKKQPVVEQGKGNHPQAVRELTDAEEDLVFRSSEFGDKNPEALQRTVWWLLALVSV